MDCREMSDVEAMPCMRSLNSAGNPLTIDSVTLTYDALGRMVEQARGTTYTQIVYGPDGGKLALMNGATLGKALVPLPGGGAAVYTSSGLNYYRHADWLGSGRLATTPVTRTMYFDVAYGPCGEGYAPSGSVDLDFTGQTQDTVSGLHDFLFREYNANQGRWPWPDPAGMGAVSIENPQSWNRYAYVGNMPLTSVDQLGLMSDAVQYLRAMARTAGFFSRFEFFPIITYGHDHEQTGFFGFVGSGSGSLGGPPANNKTNCSHGLGIGVQAGGTAAAGLKSGGVLTGQLGGGLFVNSSGPSVGGYASGALAGRWGGSTGGFPAQSLQAPWVGGAYAGYGPGIFITNAGSPAQLGGPFAVLNVDIGIGIGKASIQLAADKNGTMILTINGGPAPLADGLGFDVSGFTSNTKAVGTGCKD